MKKVTASIAPLEAVDLDAADRIFRVAFGTFLGAPEPERFFGDAEYVRGRWRAQPDGALAAHVGGTLVGTNFATNWGSVGFFGPLTVTPELWDAGIATQLLERTMACFESWGTRHAGLFTFPASTKHVGLYQRFGFWPRYLTAITTCPIPEHLARGTEHRLSALPEAALDEAVAQLRGVCDAVHPGLDVTVEVRSVLSQGLGDVLVVDDDTGVRGFAVCHVGARTEAGSGTCYVKFAAVRPGPRSDEHLGELLDASLRLARDAGALAVAAGANAERSRAWRLLGERGFRPQMLGVAMHRPNEPGYNRDDVLLVDDWR